jgi:hypothetical protein
MIMEGFLESFLYLLITIVILVLSMRKKKPVDPETGEAPRPGDPFSEIFGTDHQEEYEEAPPPLMVADDLQNGTGTHTSWMSEAERKRSILDFDQILKEAAENNPIALQEGGIAGDAYGLDNPDYEQIHFDLKKAVIYSEIIERRVF